MEYFRLAQKLLTVSNNLQKSLQTADEDVQVIGSRKVLAIHNSSS